MITKPSVLFITMASLGLQTQVESCSENQGKYVSALNGINLSYCPIPLANDSIKSAVYISGAYFEGDANDGYDIVDGGKLSLHKTWQIGRHFQSYAGGGFVLGQYMFDTGYAVPQLGRVPDNKLFGSAKLQGGVNFVIPFKQFELRPIGIQLSTHQEFGDFLKFRKMLKAKDSLRFIVSQDNFSTFGLYTEVVGKFGFRLDLGLVLNGEYLGKEANRLTGSPRFSYYTMTMHHTFFRRHTLYLQISNYSNSDREPGSAEIGYTYRFK